jgi:hypothetical protein
MNSVRITNVLVADAIDASARSVTTSSMHRLESRWRPVPRLAP